MYDTTTKHYHVKSIKEAWEIADRIFPTDYELNERNTAHTGYNVWTTTSDSYTGAKYCWISDLGNRLEVNLPYCETVNIWIDDEPPAGVTEYNIDEALKIIDEALYQIDDKINDNLSKELGIDEARDTLYEAFAKARDLLNRYYPESKLIDKYNLNEA